MLFNVERDLGTKIVAYVVPDSAGTTPSIRLRSNGNELLTIEANQTRQNLVSAGRHETGRCGFAIDEKLVPGLAGYTDLEISEAATDLLVYRRPSTNVIDAKVFRLESHLLPLWRIDNCFKDRFQFWYRGIERYGFETANQVFNLNNVKSCYISGRLLVRNFDYYLSQNFKSVGIIRDPYHELAERLIVLKNIGSRADEILGVRDAMSYALIGEALEEVEEFDEPNCKRFFRKAPVEVLATLSNPLVRALTGSNFEDMPAPTGVSMALDTLAGFEVLGLRSEAASFSQAFAELLGVDPSEIPVLDEYPRIVEVGERLRQISDVESILEKDLEVFQVIKRAFASTQAQPQPSG